MARQAIKAGWMYGKEFKGKWFPHSTSLIFDTKKQAMDAAAAFIVGEHGIGETLMVSEVEISELERD